MTKERDTLLRIEALPEPRHLFIMPEWADTETVDALVTKGYLECQYQQRNEKGDLLVAMGLHITAKGERLTHPDTNRRTLFVKGSLAGASFVAMSLLILYVG
jgi:hypothetical protein